MPVVDELIAILGYRIEGKQKLKEFQSGIDGAQKKASASIGAIGRAAGAMGLAAGAAAGVALKNFAGFEREMTRIGITAGASAEATAKAGEVVQRLAQDFSLPIDQAVKGLDTLVASGQSLDEAMAFLPSVLATAQAAGAATSDIANTALKASSALGIEAEKLQLAFDVMVTGGKAGQFELKDMAQFIPELANSFASLGYKGEDGLKKLIALLQTVREDTGSASGAATQLQNIFGKIYSEETAKNFADFGVDLEAALKKARAAGEDTIAAFVRISNEVAKGDLSKLPKLFGDQEFRLGMQSLMTSADSYKKFIDVVNGSQVDGAVLNDLNRVLSDAQSKIDRLGTSWDRFMKAIGGAVSGPASAGMDFTSNTLAFDEALRKGAATSGMSMPELFIKQPFMSRVRRDELARKGGFVPIKGVVGEELYRGADSSRPAPAKVPGPQASGPIAAQPEGIDQLRKAMGSNPDATRAALEAVAAKVDGMNAHLADMTSRAPVNATVTDARQFPVTNNITVNQTVQQVTQAPGAAANAVAGAIKQSAGQASGPPMQPSRMQAGPTP